MVKVFVFIILMFGGLLFAAPVLAQNISVNQLIGNQASNNTITPPKNTPGSTGKPINQFDQPISGSLGSLVSKLINIFFTLIATIAVIFIIIGGFRLITSQGNSTQTTTARKTITWAVGGLVLALLAFALVRLVVGALY